MTMITPSYLGETIEYSSLHACRSTLEDPTGWFANRLHTWGGMGLANVDSACVRGRAIRVTSECLRFDLGWSSSGYVFGDRECYEDRDRR